MRPIVVMAVSALVLTACGGSATVRESWNDGFVQLQGASLELMQPLTVPAGRARVFIQDGRAGTAFDQYRAHCALEIGSVQHDGHTVQRDTFRITRVQHSLQQVVMREPVRLAAVGLLPAGLFDGRGGAAYHEGYHLWLGSEQQPEVRRLSCYGSYDEPPDLRPPTLREIAEALGGIARIRS